MATTTSPKNGQPVQSAAARLEALSSRPRRPAHLHAGAAAISVISFALLLIWIASNQAHATSIWVTLDTLFCILAALEFMTRSGLRWDRRSYILTHIFDFIALVPAILLVRNDVFSANLWAWLILAARTTRLADRLLGDGFVALSITRVLERFEQAVTDRVLLRLLEGVERGLAGGRLGSTAGAALAANREAILARIRSSRPSMDKVPLGQVLGLEQRVRDVETQTFDAVVEVMSSAEVDRALRDVLTAALTDLRTGLGAVEHPGSPARPASAALPSGRSPPGTRVPMHRS